MDVQFGNVIINDIANFDSLEAAWDCFNWLKHMRENHPVYYDPNEDVWNVFLYEDVKRVLHDHTLFTNKKKRSSIPIPRNLNNRSNLNFSDPPEHQKRRALLAKAFTPRSLKDWEPRVQAITDELVDEMEGRREIDIVQSLSIPLPVIVIADLLGVPSKDRNIIKKWSDTLFYPYEQGSMDEIRRKKQQAHQEFFQYLYPIVLEKRHQLTDDIISDLIRAEIDGERLTDEEIVLSSIGLLGAGNETTTQLISNCFYCFLIDKPSTYKELRENHDLIPKAIEEVLRYRFFAKMDREIAQDTNVFGPKMKKGQAIVAWISAGNRDERQFASPE
jgi:cytochrome P450